jgi:hypothetical protein
MDDLTINRIAQQLGAALVNQAILQGQVDALKAENAALKEQINKITIDANNTD